MGSSKRNEPVILTGQHVSIEFAHKEPGVCQNNGRYQKVNLPLQSTPFSNKAFDQVLNIRP
jgi:hypothetical protein